MGNLHLSKCLKAICCTAAVLVAGAFSGYAQGTVTVSGTVTDAEGLPLIGAGVLVDGSTSGVSTDFDGNYTITAPADASLRFTYISMTDAVEPINGRSVINVVLHNETTALDAVVVTAMGISKSEKSLSYNVQQAKLENVAPVGSFVNSLNGKVAGVAINQSSTGIGGASRIVMRGSKSISNNNNALYVIDGIPMQSQVGTQPTGGFEGAGQTGDILGTLNQDDIESISVLSGPSAAALYGANAANGVIIITTKKGQKDTFEINYANNTTFSTAYIMPSFQNTYGPSEEGSYYSWGPKLATASSYNPRDFFQTGLNEVNSLSLSTGTERSQTYVSASVANATGIVHNNKVNRYNVTVRNTTDLIKDKVTLDLNGQYGRVFEQNMTAQGEYGNPVVPVYLFPAGGDWSRVQIYERYNSARNLKTQWWPSGWTEHSMQNPYWITEHQKWQNNKDRLMASAQLSYKPVKWLTLSVRGKFDRTDGLSEEKYDAGTNTLFTEGSIHGKYSRTDDFNEQRFGEFLATFNKYFGAENTFNVSGVVGANIDDVRYERNFNYGPLASINNLFNLNNIDRANSKTKMQTSGWHSQNQSIFANAQLGYKSMVYLDLTAREDWSSTLVNTGIFYPTVGLSGILTELVPNIKSKFFPYWKVRVSYSEVGNSPAADLFLTDEVYTVTDGKPGTSSSILNKSLVPERTKSWELGTNIHFFDSKLQIDATYYKSSTYNQFYNPRISSTSESSNYWVNGGQVDNRGVEAAIRFNDSIGKFNYGFYATYTWNKNEIVSLEFPDENGVKMKRERIPMGGFGGLNTFLYEGGTLGDVYVTTLKTDENGYLSQTDKGMVIADLSEDNMVYAGTTDAKHRMSFGGNFGYAGFNLGFLFTARFGGIVVSKTQAMLDYYGVSQDTADARDKGYIDVNGMKLYDVQGYYQTLTASSGVMSQYVYSADNIRLSEISLGYDFPVQKWGVPYLKGLNFSVVGNNLLMLYMKAPFDPEMTSNVGTYNQGVDYFMQPSTRSLGFSVKVKF